MGKEGKGGPAWKGFFNTLNSGEVIDRDIIALGKALELLSATPLSL